MSMFRRPTDDSSDSDSSSEESDEEEGRDHSNAGTDHSNAGTEEIVGADLTTAETVSSGESISVEHSHDESAIADVEQVRNMMLASLLEDFYRTRAAEFLNTANPGAHFHRQSPEVQPLARNLFAQASQTLLSNGLLPAAAMSDDFKTTRLQYLAGFDHFTVHNIQTTDILSESAQRRISASDNSLALIKATPTSHSLPMDTSNYPVRDLAMRTDRMSIVPHPANDMQLSFVQQPRSHYKSSFQEVCLLGRGGFGRVYQTYNVFDKKEYAVKKIPLSVKLSQQYRDKGHAELASILREVQALAQLDHCNVVRYHATWIEDPVTPFLPPDPPTFRQPFNRQRLITNAPTSHPPPANQRRSSTRFISFGTDDNIRFEADSSCDLAAQDAGLGWTHNSNVRQQDSSVQESDIFTDGMPHNNRSDKVVDDPSCYVLHVQMSMYPTTLAQYLSTPPAGARRGSNHSSGRHCFHLLPTLRILLGILSGLQYIHARGLIHRDIKPSNIFLSDHDTETYLPPSDGYQDVGTCPSCAGRQPYHVNPRIGDFGLVADLARDNESSPGSHSSSGSIVGTEYYRPPAAAGKQPARIIDEKIDVYALGVILVELLWQCGTNMERINLLKGVQKGKVPEEIAKTIEGEALSPGNGKVISECIEGMIEKDHRKRWTCAKVRECLESVMAQCLNTSQSTDKSSFS